MARYLLIRGQRATARLFVVGVAVCLVVTACGDQTGADKDSPGDPKHAAASSVPPQSLPSPIPVSASTLKLDGPEWQFSPGPAVLPDTAVSSSTALAAATKEVHGDSLTPDSKPEVSLVFVTNLAPKPQAIPMDHRLAWVIQLDNVPIARSRPLPANSYSSSDNEPGPNGMVQWIIDATSGEYVAARDWG